MAEYLDEKGNKIQAVPQAEYDKLVAEKAKLESASKELSEIKEKQVEAEKKAAEVQAKALETKRADLIKAGVDADKVAKMPMELLEVLETTIGMQKKTPKMDMGSGGGMGALSGSPYDLARQAYTK